MMRISLRLALVLLLTGASPTLAQDAGTLDKKPLPPLEHPDSPTTPARELFGRKTKPVPLAARSIGGYAKGCLAGAVALPINGPTWQVMRLSRNRNWGHPLLIAFLERLAQGAKKVGWNGLLVGDMSQPRGGPMLTGHASHQIGLDADIWLTPMPDHVSHARGAGVHVRRQHGGGRIASTSIAKVWTHDPHSIDPHCGGRSRCRTHFRQCGDQEGDVPRGGVGSRLARQSAAVVGPRLSFPRPHRLPGRQPELQAATAAGAERRLRPRARLLVLGSEPASASRRPSRRSPGTG